MKRGFFISVEGTDGAGKSTQLSRIETALRQRGFDVLVTREPGGTPVGEKIRAVLLDPENADMEPMTEALLYAAARAQLVREVIRPALEKGRVVLSDRFVDSSLAYQGFGRGLGDCVRDINAPAVDGLLPDLTIFLDVPPERGMTRIARDGRQKDRLEQEPEAFRRRVYEGFKTLADRDPARFRVIDACGTVEDVSRAVEQALEDFLIRRGSGGEQRP